MFGTYRLLLAIMVAFSHIYGEVGIFNTGVWAVVNFYILSGYVICSALKRNYLTSKKIKYFYIDRVLRIFPQYFFYIFLTFFLWNLDLIKTRWISDSSLLYTISNITVIPLNYLSAFKPNPRFFLIPAAWSLGLELQFYLVIPFILMYKNLRKYLFIISFLIAILAAFHLINTERFGYIYLIGVLFIFLVGSYLYEIRYKILIIIYILICTISILLQFCGMYKYMHNLEIYSGIIIGLPFIWKLSNIHRNKIDDLLGNISYGVFLCHFLVKCIMENFQIFNDVSKLMFTFIAILISIILGSISFYLIEKPFINLKKMIREKKYSEMNENIFIGNK